MCKFGYVCIVVHISQGDKPEHADPNNTDKDSNQSDQDKTGSDRSEQDQTSSEQSEDLNSKPEKVIVYFFF